MPKDVSERIIDSPFAPTTRVGTVAIGGGGGGGGGGGATNLDALTDVTLSSVSNGQTLSYNSGTGQWINAAPAAMVAHNLSGSYHTGQLNWGLINFGLDSDLADIAIRRHIDLQGIGPDDHHNQAHLLATGTALGADHTISGAAAGEVLRALSATTAAFDVLQHTDLGNILPDQHHPFVHDIIANVPGFGTAHTVTGADFTVVGVHPADTLALLPTSSAPGAAVSILKTDANGGIQLDTNLLYVDGANNRIGVNVVPGAGPAGGAAALDLLTSNNADHTQRIRQKSGQTGRLWRVENTAGHELIVMDSDGSLMSGNPLFVSGLAGWNITPEGNAEFNNIWARGELHATVFVKDEVHATGGSFMVATAGVLHDDAVIDATTVDDDVLVVYSTAAGVGAGVPLQVVTTSGTFTGNELHVSWIRNVININDPPSGPGFYFQPGDIVRSKTEVPTGVTDFWLEINSAVQNSGYSSYSVLKRSGTDGTLPKGSAVVSYGKEGDGRILMTSDLQFAPYIDVFTTGTNVWTGAAGAVKERMRMGRLDGIKVPGIQGIEQYGMIAGKDLTDANQGYFIASNLQFSLYKINIRLNDGSNDTGLWTADGTLRIGKNVSADATTGFKFDSSTGDLIIGDQAKNNYMRWNQVAGTLVVSGTLLVTDPGTTVTLAQVNALDDQVRTDAQGYATTAQTNSIGYSDARRIIGVSGSWFSPGTNRVSWGTKGTATLTGGTALAVVFANPNTTRTIADPTSPFYITISARTYLYVSMSGSGTMTMLSTTSIATVSAANNVLIAVCDPGDPAVPSAARLASITVVAGSTYVSGGNIFTGSITAGNIASHTITANEILGNTLTLSEMATDVTGAIGNAQTGAQSYGDARRVTGVSGTWTVIDGNTINWTGVSVKFANGTARAITASAGNYTFASTGRWFLFVDMSPGTLSMVSSGSPSTSINALGINDVLIAVVDTYASPGKASINIVAGSTYISGGNIIAQSIRATEIAATTLTLGNMASDVTGAITAAQTAGDNAQTTADDNKLYADARRVMGVSGAWGVIDGNQITWASLQVKFANLTARTITASATAPTGYTLSGAAGTRHYLFIDVTDSTPAMQDTTAIGSLGVNHALIAVVDVGTLMASINVVAGSTYISGNNILTGSIVATNIAASAVEADKILVNDNIDVKTNGSITGNGKGYNTATPGFFMGYHSGAYKFHLGTLTSSLIWDGGNMFMKLNQALDITNTSTGNILSMTGTGGSTAILSLDSTGLISSDDFFAPVVRAGKFIQLDATFQIEDARTIAHTTSTGLMGEICWDVNYLYVCYATNLWRRIRLDPLDTW